jgi:hypothetical protein
VTPPAADDLLPSLAELLGQIAQTMRGGATDPAAGRAAAATQVDQLRALLARAGTTSPPGSPPLFDATQLGDALGRLADALRASGGEPPSQPPNQQETDALAAITQLRAAMGPRAGAAPRDGAAEREHYRQKASAAMDEYFRQHPHKPFKP